MNYRLTGHMVTAISTLASGILLGVIYLNFFIPFPFVLAAFLYFIMPPTQKTLWLAIGSVGIIFFGLILGLSFITEGFGGSQIMLVEGIAMVLLSMMAIAPIIHSLLTRKAVRKAAQSNSSP
jgi:hypothetical protein